VRTGQVPAAVGIELSVVEAVNAAVRVPAGALCPGRAWLPGVSHQPRPGSADHPGDRDPAGGRGDLGGLRRPRRAPATARSVAFGAGSLILGCAALALYAAHRRVLALAFAAVVLVNEILLYSLDQA